MGMGQKLTTRDRRFWSLVPFSRASHFGNSIFLTHSHMFLTLPLGLWWAFGLVSHQKPRYKNPGSPNPEAKPPSGKLSLGLVLETEAKCLGIVVVFVFHSRRVRTAPEKELPEKPRVFEKLLFWDHVTLPGMGRES